MVLKFWSKSINSFMLPFGPISILEGCYHSHWIALSIAVVLCLLDTQDSSLLAIEVSSTIQTSYFATIQRWHDVTVIPSTVERVEFLWVLLCIYVFFLSHLENQP